MQGRNRLQCRTRSQQEEQSIWSILCNKYHLLLCVFFILIMWSIDFHNYPGCFYYLTDKLTFFLLSSFTFQKLLPSQPWLANIVFFCFSHDVVYASHGDQMLRQQFKQQVLIDLKAKHGSVLFLCNNNLAHLRGH